MSKRCQLDNNRFNICLNMLISLLIYVKAVIYLVHCLYCDTLVFAYHYQALKDILRNFDQLFHYSLHFSKNKICRFSFLTRRIIINRRNPFFFRININFTQAPLLLLSIRTIDCHIYVIENARRCTIDI